MPAAPARDRWRAAWLWGGLALTLALTGWTALQPDDPDPAPALVAPRLQRDRASAAAAAVTAVTAAEGAVPSSPTAPAPRGAWVSLGPAGRSAWTPPPPPPPAASQAPGPARPVAEAPAPPQAPPPPFTLIGRYHDSRGPVALLATPQRTLAVREGELADPQWRVDRVAAQRIELTWMPGAQKRSLAYPPGT
jgi:hypothetical protein